LQKFSELQNRDQNLHDSSARCPTSETINRAIKGLKWQAYGYKNTAYFALKIMQKCGYLNHRQKEERPIHLSTDLTDIRVERPIRLTGTHKTPRKSIYRAPARHKTCS
jgi:hypothetical protein